MFDDGESTYDRLARSEREVNEARKRREEEERKAARSQRETLEKGSPSGARRGLVGLSEWHGREHSRPKRRGSKPSNGSASFSEPMTAPSPIKS